MFCCAAALAAEPASLPDFEVARPAGPEGPAAGARDPLGRRLDGHDRCGLLDHPRLPAPAPRPVPHRQSATTRRPLVVFVHGGGWWTANQRAASAFLDFPAVLANLAQRGYVVASIEYRLSGEAPFPAQLLDLQEAVRFLRANAARFGIDPAKVALWGMSAGAQLAALDAVTCGAPSGDSSDKQAGRRVRLRAGIRRLVRALRSRRVCA